MTPLALPQLNGDDRIDGEFTVWIHFRAQEIMARVTVTKGSGNVFRDLGFSEEKSTALMLKSSLLQSIQGTIKWK